jgi:hypothetical protein
MVCWEQIKSQFVLAVGSILFIDIIKNITDKPIKCVWKRWIINLKYTLLKQEMEDALSELRRYLAFFFFITLEGHTISYLPYHIVLQENTKSSASRNLEYIDGLHSIQRQFSLRDQFNNITWTSWGFTAHHMPALRETYGWQASNVIIRAGLPEPVHHERRYYYYYTAQWTKTLKILLHNNNHLS